MKKIYYALALVVMLIGACKKEQTLPEIDNTSVSTDILAKLKSAGFDTSQGLSKYKNGYIVEGDIFMTEEAIDDLNSDSKVLIPQSYNLKLLKLQSKNPISHYRTNEIVTSNSNKRTIAIYMDSSFGTYLQNCLDSALNRFNQIDLNLVFARAFSPSSANIVVSPVSSASFLMSAGFPSSGNPYNQIYVNTIYYNSSFNRLDATSSLVHEIGHTLGLRHTDYMNRAFSCNSVNPGNNEGAGTVGANPIIGTSTQPEFGSVMLACSDGTDRKFTSMDIIALKSTYWYRKNIYVKPIQTEISNESYYTTYNDYVKITYNITAEFYQDAALTIPYTTSDYLVLNIYNDNEFSHHMTRILVPNGISSYDIGNYVQEKEYNFGNLVSDNTSGYKLEYGLGYYLFPHYEYY